MLSKIRDKHIKKILWGLIIIIVPAFVLWGGISSLRGRKKNVIGAIDNKTLTMSDFYYYIKMARIYLLLNNPQGRQINAYDIERLAEDFTVLLWKAKKEKITASNQEVINYLIDNFFPKGKFDQQIYETFITSISRRYNLGLTTRNFEEYIRDFIKVNKLFEQKIKITIENKTIENLYKKDTQQAKINYLFIPYDNFKVETGISPKDIDEFYKDNQVLFKREPQVKINYALIKKDSLNDEELNAISNAKYLMDLKDKFSLEIEKTGFLYLDDPIEEIGWRPDINRVAFSLSKNEVSDPIQTGKGLIIMEKIDEKKASIPPLETVKDDVIERLIKKNSEDKAKKFANEILKQIKEDSISNLKRFSKKDSVEFKATDFFKYYDYIEGLGLDERISRVVFSLNEKEVYSEVLLLLKGMAIIQLNAITPFDEKDFGEKKQNYADRIKQNKEIVERIKFLDGLRKEANFSILPSQLTADN